MSESTPALWPTEHQAVLAGQSPAIPGPDGPTASTQSPEERLLDALENLTTIDEDVERARRGWVAAVNRRFTHGHDDVSARVRLLDGQVAYLQHVLADLMALVDGSSGHTGDLTREEMGAYTAQDLVLGGYRYATATLRHGAQPTFGWADHVADGCPHEACVADGLVHDVTGGDPS